jgi:hypothetical protein
MPATPTTPPVPGQLSDFEILLRRVIDALAEAKRGHLAPVSVLIGQREWLAVEEFVRNDYHNSNPADPNMVANLVGGQLAGLTLFGMPIAPLLYAHNSAHAESGVSILF